VAFVASLPCIWSSGSSGYSGWDEHPVFWAAACLGRCHLVRCGANDAQRPWGVIAALLLGRATGLAADSKTVLVPEWVALSSRSHRAVGCLGRRRCRDNGLGGDAAPTRRRREHQCDDSASGHHLTAI
jgi:hypothetical protein